jgi:hypothetical protein
MWYNVNSGRFRYAQVVYREGKMVVITHVTQETLKDGTPVVYHDPRRGLSDYSVYTIHLREPLTELEAHLAPDFIVRWLRNADYDGEPKFELVARRPICCYVRSRRCIELILFSKFEPEMIMKALASGELNSTKKDNQFDYDPYCHC